MERAEALQQLNEIMRDILDDPSVTLTPATTADDIEGWDSMSHITFLVEIEAQFGVKFQSSEISAMRNVGELLDVIARRKAA